MTKTKNIALLLAASLALAPSALFAQDGSDMFMNKYVSGPDDDGVYTLTLESYAKGAKTIIETHTATDIVLVLDVSGSMDETITGKSSAWSSKNAGFSYDDITDDDYYYKWTDGKYYQVYGIANSDGIFYYDRCWLYFEVGNNRYYLKGDGKAPILASSNTDPTYGGISGTQPTDTNGNTIEPVIDDDEEIWTGTLYYHESTGTVTKFAALKSAVNSFITNVYEDTQKDYDKDGKPDNLDHRISIVKFSDDYYDEDNLIAEGNHFHDGIFSDYAYTEVVKNFKYVKTAKEELQTAVGKIKVGGPTAADYGMTLAKKLFESTKDNGKYPAKPRIVIFFTDGDPNHGSGFDEDVANSTIALSKNIKATSSDLTSIGATVFTIGILSNSDSDVNKFMNYVSSNYPSAESMTKIGDPASSDYYKNVSDESALISVFKSIAKEIGGTEITLDATSQVIDIITSDFTLPVGASVTDITVKTATYDASTNSFATPAKFNDAQVTLTGNNKITVSNFNFSEHWCGSGATSGQKLIIEIPIIESSTNKGGINIPTNEVNSGIYERDGDNTPMFKYTPPVVSIPLLKVVKKGMNAGESAVFTITEGTGDSARTFTVTAVGTGSDVTTVIKAKDKTTYSVAETGWSWTYTPDSTDPQSFTFNGEAEKTFTFTNESKTIDVDHAEAVVKNNFKEKTSTVTRSK